jgi:hypothetical protein
MVLVCAQGTVDVRNGYPESVHDRQVAEGRKSWHDDTVYVPLNTRTQDDS